MYQIMRKRKLVLFSVLCLCLPVGAQTLHLSGTLIGDGFQGTTLNVSVLDGGKSGKVTPLHIENARFEGDVPKSPDGFYFFSGTNKGGQTGCPFYWLQEGEEAEPKLSMSGNCLQVEMNADSRALSVFNEVYYKRGRELWVNGHAMNSEQIKAFLKGYKSAADSIAWHYQCSEPVSKYLSLWAYTVMADSYASISHITGKRAGTLPFTIADLQKEPSEVLDTPMALYFSSAASIIVQSLPKGSLKERLHALNEHYSCKPVRERVADALLSYYIGSFNYGENYEEGLAELESIVKDFGLSSRYISDFKARKATIKGNPFPKDVLLTDVDGHKVDFGNYKGYYVYIDLWASWCVPCCREVPHLQKLEKELNNKEVKLVSISIDKDTKSWKARMEALNMHGNQLINQDNKLAEALNVGGIPHFLIYDKEGKLFQYRAPRPSSGEELRQLLENLH